MSNASVLSSSAKFSLSGIGFVAGPLLFLVTLVFFESSVLSPRAGAVIAGGVWMITWWISDAVPIPVTALLPMVLFTVTGVFSMGEATAPYASPIIFLFMGGFIIALAMEKRNLHRRIALSIIRLTGTSANGIILGFMLATAFLSMWISNTATSVMMLPIALSVINLLISADEMMDNTPYRRFALGLMLGIAYAANIGGTTTLIGTPPNVVMVGYIREFTGVEMSFGRWLLIGLPSCSLLLFLTYFLITRVLFPHRLKQLAGSGELIESELQKLGPVSKAEKLVTVVFSITAFSWIFQQNVNEALRFVFALEESVKVLNNTNIAMAGGILMFITPVKFSESEFVLDWKSTEKLPWGILLLFGGGLCLAKGMEKSGIIQWVGDAIAGNQQVEVWVIMLSLTAFTLFMTEITSNVALMVIFLPVVISIAETLQVAPLYLAIPVTIASSCAFMMPISTPPNAVVFSSGYIKIMEMARAGFLLNILAILILVLFGITLVQWVY